MAIRIARNDAGNCINFFGSSNPTYWNAILEGEVSERDTNLVNVVNSVRTIESETKIYEFYEIPYTDFADKDGNAFENASECAQYITDNANVSGNQGTFLFSEVDTLDAVRDATNTTVLFSNGDIFAVNSLTASAAADGTITIGTVRGDKDVYATLRYYNTTVSNGTVVMRNLNSAVDRLNEVLSGASVGSDGGNSAGEIATAPESTNTFTIYGDRLVESGSGATAGYTSTAVTGNFDTSNGIYSNQLISKPGEFFEFEQVGGDWTNSGNGLTFGLFDDTEYDVTVLEVDEAGNQVKSPLRLRINNTPFCFKDPDNDYGKFNEAGFVNSPQTKTKFRVGLDADNKGFISQDIGGGIFELVSRTKLPLPANNEFRFIVIFPLANVLEGVRNFTTNLLDTAPSLTWNYIESPDGVFHYPLFNSAEQANYVDEEYGTAAPAAGSSHQEIFPDEQPAQNIWYMPNTYAFEEASSAPGPLSGVVWNEILTGNDANYVPSQFADNTISVNEGVSINLQIRPAGDAATYNVTGIPTGLAFDSFGFLVGNAPAVSGNTTTNPSDTYTITVTKANDYGSSVGTLTLVVNNTTAPSVALSGFTWNNTSTPLINSTTMDAGSVVAFDDTLDEGKRLIIDKAWVETHIYPNLANINDEVFIGIPKSTADWSSVDISDFEISMRWIRQSSTIIENYLNVEGGANNGIGIGSLTDALYDFGFEVDNGTTYAIACATADMNTEPSPSDGGSFTRIVDKASFAGPHTIVIATVNTETTLSTSGIGEITAPVPSSILTDWNKAINFSGGSEYLMQVSSGNVYNNALRMGGLSQLASANSDSSKTSNDTNSRPWAIAAVFQTPNNNTNQHIWNSGEGAGSGDDNMYLRITGSNGACYFGWGREGVGYNEYLVGNFGGSYNQSTGTWWGVYISHDGTRLNSSDATAANLINAFDIRIMLSNDNPAFGNLYNIGNDVSRWTSTGVRMDRTMLGDFTIGGRGSNRSFHGKVASMVLTTLRRGVTKPTDAEIELMIKDPIKWEDDYRVGQQVRNVNDGNNALYMSSIFAGYGGTQIWLMGDGVSDAYSQGIRNQVSPGEQNYTKLQLNSMVSNDIETVSISGLS